MLLNNALRSKARYCKVSYCLAKLSCKIVLHRNVRCKLCCSSIIRTNSVVHAQRAVPRASTRAREQRLQEYVYYGNNDTSNRNVSTQEHMVDALPQSGEEGRGNLRKASGRGKHPVIRRSPNGATRRESCLVTPATESKPRELKHLSTGRKRKQVSDFLSSGERTGRSLNQEYNSWGCRASEATHEDNRMVWEVQPKKVKVL